MQRAVTALLGPTNTGKTYLAIERMLSHPSGMVGFPLRLLARENYDRVAALKGPEAVALITGEERIVPRRPAYFICTVEAMPLEHKVAIILNTIHYGVQLVVAPLAELSSAPTEVLLDERVRMIHVAHRVDAAAVVFALDPVTDTKSKIVRWHSIAALRIDQSGAVTRVTHRESK